MAYLIRLNSNGGSPSGPAERYSIYVYTIHVVELLLFWPNTLQWLNI